MIELLKLFPLVFLLVTHPLEQIHLKDYDFSRISTSFIHEYHYIAPDNGFIKNVIEAEDGSFQITLLLENRNEIVYSGLSELMKKDGDSISIGEWSGVEWIGSDMTISQNTKYIMDLFENPVGSLTSLAKCSAFCRFLAVVVRKLRFPNNSNYVL